MTFRNRLIIHTQLLFGPRSVKYQHITHMYSCLVPKVWPINTQLTRMHNPSLVTKVWPINTQLLFEEENLLTTNRSQKSPKSGLSIAFKLSFVAASTLTYNCRYQIKSDGLAVKNIIMYPRFFSNKDETEDCKPE